jgi:endonuclease/exonuclease/phosphatase family metal-dependent hydrolase
MTFNIRHGCGRENWGNTSSGFFKGCTKKYDPIIAAIRSVDPDVVGLQEISSGQAGLIAKALNMNYAYYSHNPSGYGSWWGNAVLSKFKILDAKKIEIGGSAGKNRSMISAIGLVNDTPVIFASVHTDHRLRDDRSIRRILNYLGSTTEPAVLIGDFNMSPQSPQANSLTDDTGLLDSAGSPGYGQMGTWASPSGQRIDYVFVQSQYFNVLDAALVSPEHHGASDHIAYYTTLEMK